MVNLVRSVLLAGLDRFHPRLYVNPVWLIKSIYVATKCNSGAQSGRGRPEWQNTPKSADSSEKAADFFSFGL
ncbi:MAG: hypothetical protein AB1584_17190 [Pseudomonadota bacterium]